MKKNNQLLAILAVGLLAGPTVAPAQGYDYVSVDYPGASGTNLFGVNDQGDAVGNGFVDPDNFPFVYDTKKGTLSNVAPVAGYDSTSILGISNNGDMVGSVDDLAANVQSGLILDRNGASMVFDHPDALSSTQARAVNNNGVVTGFRDTTDPSQVLASFIYDQKTGTFTDVVPSAVTIAQGINNRGDVVGSAIFFPAEDPCDSGSPSTSRYGWVRDAGGNVTYFNVNGLRTSARGITDSGTVVGFASDPFTGETKGFVTELDGTQCQTITIAEADLIQFPGAVTTFVQGITNAGVIVGAYQDEFGFGGGFIATEQ